MIEILLASLLLLGIMFSNVFILIFMAMLHILSVSFVCITAVLRPDLIEDSSNKAKDHVIRLFLQILFALGAYSLYNLGFTFIAGMSIIATMIAFIINAQMFLKVYKNE